MVIVLLLLQLFYVVIFGFVKILFVVLFSHGDIVLYFSFHLLVWVSSLWLPDLSFVPLMQDLWHVKDQPELNLILSKSPLWYEWDCERCILSILNQGQGQAKKSGSSAQDGQSPTFFFQSVLLQNPQKVEILIDTRIPVRVLTFFLFILSM